MPNYYIYKITNFINNKVYIGQAVNPEKRWNKHLWASRNIENHEQVIHKAMTKYGSDNFNFEIIDEQYSQESVDAAEIYFIALYNSCNREYGYNVSKGGAFYSGWNKITFNEKDVEIILTDTRSYEDIAKNFNIHEDVIRRIYKENNKEKITVSKRYRKYIFSDVEIENILSDSRTYKAIAEAYNVNVGYIQGLYKKYSKRKSNRIFSLNHKNNIGAGKRGKKNKGQQPNKVQFTQEEVSRIINDLRSDRLIAKDFNVSRKVIRRVNKENGKIRNKAE